MLRSLGAASPIVHRDRQSPMRDKGPPFQSTVFGKRIKVAINDYLWDVGPDDGDLLLGVTPHIMGPITAVVGMTVRLIFYL